MNSLVLPSMDIIPYQKQYLISRVVANVYNSKLSEEEGQDLIDQIVIRDETELKELLLKLVVKEIRYKNKG